jgi:thioredoxin reductase (NADPH)
MGATYQAFCDTIGIHPTSAEEFTILTITRSSGESTEKGGC